MNTALIKPQWSPITIALMVMGFVIFWPIGMLVLGYILWGEKFGGSADKAQSYWNKGRDWCAPNRGRGRGRRHGFDNHHYAQSSSGNAAFDDYRADQLRRLEEERARLDAEIEAFHDYMANLNKAKDREEFDRFMNERRGSRQGYNTPKTDDNNGGNGGGNNDGDNNGWGNGGNP